MPVSEFWLCNPVVAINCATMREPASLLQTWKHTTPTSTPTLVLPDGCCDLIVRVAPQQSPQWFVSALADTAYQVDSVTGETFQGYRFQPGAQINVQALLTAMSQSLALTNHAFDDADVLPLIEAFVRLDERVSEALSSLAQSHNITTACRQLGVSERSLERLVKAATGRTPGYWKSLARVRRAACALAGADPISAIASDHGYADQAHLGRECRRWLGLAPAQLRHSPDLLRILAESGYG
jgi:AraC-like DNA-binding protein